MSYFLPLCGLILLTNFWDAILALWRKGRFAVFSAHLARSPEWVVARSSIAFPGARNLSSGFNHNPSLPRCACQKLLTARFSTFEPFRLPDALRQTPPRLFEPVQQRGKVMDVRKLRPLPNQRVVQH